MTQSTVARKSDRSEWKGRLEDDALLRGTGRFGDDAKPDDVLAAHFVRSPHAYATIDRMDTSAARKVAGVVAVLTAADLADAHYHSISHPRADSRPRRQGGRFGPHRPALAEKRVMHVGEPVAMVVANTAAAAHDAAELVVVDYDAA